MTDLGVWMLSLIWPGTLPDLERAFRNFHAVLRDFNTVFNQEADWINTGKGEGVVAALTNRPSEVVIPEHERQHEREHAHLVIDLALELTRAANYLCAQARKSVDAQFRVAEGALLMIFSPARDDFVRPEYADEEMGDLYPGLEEFLKLRLSRDFHWPPS